ncbi:MAG TPA: hypothetical protein VIC53_08725 [Wenzhouxiangella sp.]
MPHIRRLSLPMITLIALLGLAVWPALAKAELKLLINKGDTVGRFVIDGDVEYNVTSGVVGMDVFLGKDAAGADNPLFCFDFSTQAQAVKLDINSKSSSAATQKLAQGLKLTSALQYQLSAQTISITPSNDVACFFRAYNATSDALGTDFGLYGQAPAAPTAPSTSTDVIFFDDFSGIADLDVAFSGLATTQAGVSYNITITNKSSFALSSLAFQQSIPAGLEVTGVTCQVSGANSAACSASEEKELRYLNFSLASGEKLELSVLAKRSDLLETGTTQLPVYAAVAAPTISGVAFHVDKVTLTPL